MSDLPPPVQTLRTALLLHALVAAGILIVTALSGVAAGKALLVAALYFVLAGGWSWFRSRRATRVSASSDAGTTGRDR